MSKEIGAQELPLAQGSAGGPSVSAEPAPCPAAGAGDQGTWVFPAEDAPLRTTGSAPDDPASGRSAPPVRRLPPIGPSPNPNEARPAEPIEAGLETEEAGLEAKDARLEAEEAGLPGAADAGVAENPEDAAVPEPNAAVPEPNAAVPELDGAAGLIGCRGGIVVRVADRAEVRVGRPGDSAAFFAGTNGLGRNDSSSATTGAEPADPDAPAPNQPPAGASDCLASGIVAPGRR
ncbi:hypothetical protein AB0F72_18400 [Actinoplanes sp. NPDC023936]|uniref:hypothetical protein n=1 Tax=Actinoplanes sp. NPDC023936 TaxID=3154910 RepID=UPI0033E31B23